MILSASAGLYREVALIQLSNSALFVLYVQN